MNKGAILFHRDFQFHNGQSGEKLIIVLNTPKDKEPYLCCKTTSKQKFNIDKEGCHSPKNVYVINSTIDWFKVKTWVQFHELYEFEPQKFLQAHFKGVLEIKGELKESTVNAIRNCIRRSEDVSIYHLSLLS
ncbi:MAG TPA: hypothetical protein DDW27_03730 [Bacteroidales bacterium]|nr:hypothetical protein [Bacteroidales bacterium]